MPWGLKLNFSAHFTLFARDIDRGKVLSACVVRGAVLGLWYISWMVGEQNSEKMRSGIIVQQTGSTVQYLRMGIEAGKGSSV